MIETTASTTVSAAYAVLEHKFEGQDVHRVVGIMES